MAAEPPSMAALASKFDSDSDEEEPTVTHAHTVPSPALESTGAQQTLEHVGQDQDAHAQDSLVPGTASSDDDDEEEEDYDSYDEEEELASALQWADLQDDHAARGHATAGPVSGSTLATALHRPNAHGGAMHRAVRGGVAATPGNAQRLAARVHIGAATPAEALASRTGGGGGKRAHGGGNAGGGGRDRADRATVEQVLDPRTRLVLFKMLNRGVFEEINGVVSTGKEANVYHATDPAGQELAIKVYKTSILVFKDRDRYVVGDSRFQRYCKSNPRKMVKLWAEKEMRNLARLKAAGINAPRPLQLRMHVLAMEFLGRGGVAAPRLRDAGLPPARMRAAYTEVVLMIRGMYQKCRLVHADLSEYNILVHDNELWIIDVSQSVEPDHPRAFDFLREDCLHVNDYFRRQGVATLTTKELFDFAVDPAVTDENLDGTLDALMEMACTRPIDPSGGAAAAEAVWAQAFIPKKLDEVTNHERDHARLQADPAPEGIYYQALAGMKADMSGARTTPLVLETMARKMQGGERPDDSGEEFGLAPKSDAAERTAVTSNELASPAKGTHELTETPDDDEAASCSSSDADSDEESSASNDEWVPGEPALSREARRAARREQKKETKKSNQERRKKKMPKKEKARKMAKSKAKKK